MILGRIVGKITTTQFNFQAEQETRKFEYVQVYHKNFGYVLCLILELERDAKKITAHCQIIGYKDSTGRIRPIDSPFTPGTEVLRAESSVIQDILRLEKQDDGAYIGLLEGRDIPVYLNLKKVLTKHLAVLAKSGAGKSYAVGVLIEEIIKKKVPLLVIDPHGEYLSLKNPNDNEQELTLMQQFNIKAKGYASNIVEYGSLDLNPEARPILLNEHLTKEELTHLLPGKLTSAQLGVLYNALKYLDELTFTNLLLALEQEESAIKWNLISLIDHLSKLKLFSASYTEYNELVRPKTCSILNLKGMEPESQHIIIYKILKDLFEQRKQKHIPPFFTVIEEAHNFAPERSFGETICSRIIRTIASEGRKFGMGLCVITQRPARLDKSVLSQCTTQFILKVTNPHDLKAISNSVEGLTYESENEIKNLSIGTAMVTGVVDVPLFVRIRPRTSKHGGSAINILKDAKEPDEEKPSETFFDDLKEFEKKDMLPLIRPHVTPKDIALMSDTPVKAIEAELIPAVLFTCTEQAPNQALEEATPFALLCDLFCGEVVTSLYPYETKKIPDFSQLSPEGLNALETCFHKKKIDPAATTLDRQILKKLLSLGFLIQDKYYLPNPQMLLSALSKHAFPEKIEYASITAKKLAPEVSEEAMKTRIASFVTVTGQKPCFIVRYIVPSDVQPEGAQPEAQPKKG
ncbi:hypothetical protein COY95_01740 [Candidatus Woesearchaeota archaeon CG_4_10_14_0_8_um_filter_47_5]|nr:MAG: hypothetical protein COY95_01740 [Candidatus Woesearchaeota archaeon CG_4_10_14_0_8_um_filter_47_5]